MRSPASARKLFGPALPVAEAYASWLAGPAVERGLLGPREVPRIWDRHLMNCAVVGEAIPAAARVVDIGSGAGLPGIVLAIARPDLSIVLLEPLLRRAAFLEECVSGLGLERVQVRRARAEEVVGELTVDVVTARAVARLDRLVTWALPLLRPGGQLLAIKGERAPAELEQAGQALRRLGARHSEVVEVGRGKVEPPTTLVRVEAGERTARRKR